MLVLFCSQRSGATGPSPSVLVAAVVALLVVVRGVRRRVDLLAALLDDLLDVHDALPVAVVLELVLLLEEGLLPGVHLALHVVVLGLDHARVVLEEEVALLVHLVPLPQVFLFWSSSVRSG